MTVSDRIAVMDQGRMVQIATPAEIYEYPATRYVADFIGDVNFLSGRVTSVDGQEVRLASDEVAGDIVVTQAEAQPSVGDEAWLAIRPEKMRISLDPPAEGAANSAEGEVWDIAYLGDLSVYHVRLASGHVIKSTVTNQTRLVERPISWDDKVWVSWSPEGGVVLTR